MFALFIIAIVSFIICVYFSIKITSTKDSTIDRGQYLLGYTFAFVFFSTSLSNMIINNLDEDKPKAIDVYRDKTELIINKIYKNDSILIECDSIVVFKNVE